MYLALYRKYRPTKFDDVISQEHITTTLKNQIKTGKIAHAYLFTGSRGTGKTTCAKLLAKAVNCLSPVNGNPCGECETCKAIAEGCSDIVEMDAASNNGVDDVRALRDEVMYTPVTCKYRVYIIDEVHMMSASAFNALLKTIEEPPPHVVFILATTELHKVPATILSRCQQFSFNRVSASDSSKRLCEIAAKENVQLDETAAELISRLSDGGMRDAISLLDRCIGISTEVTEQIVRDAVGIAGSGHLFDLADCVKAKDPASALRMLDELHGASKDPILLLEELSGHFRNLMLLGAMNMDFSLIPPASGDKERLIQQARSFTLGETIRCIDILQDFVSKAARMPHRESAAQMCLIRLCKPELDTDTEALSIRLERLEKKVADILKGQIIAGGKTASASQSSTPPNQRKKTSSDVPIFPEEQPTYSPVAAEEKIEPPTPNSVKDVSSIEGEKPAWLFENDGGLQQAPPFPPPDEYGEYPPLPDETDSANTEQDGPLPFDLDEPPKQDIISHEPSQLSPASIPIPQETPRPDQIMQLDDLAPTELWSQITDGLPEFLKALLKDVKASITDKQIILSGYSPFLYDFMQKGDSLMRVEASAKQVAGRALKVVFHTDEGKDNQPEIRDRVDAFLQQAQNAGVKIKNKRK